MTTRYDNENPHSGWRAKWKIKGLKFDHQNGVSIEFKSLKEREILKNN